MCPFYIVLLKNLGRKLIGACHCFLSIYKHLNQEFRCLITHKDLWKSQEPYQLFSSTLGICPRPRQSKVEPKEDPASKQSKPGSRHLSTLTQNNSDDTIWMVSNESNVYYIFRYIQYQRISPKVPKVLKDPKGITRILWNADTSHISHLMEWNSAPYYCNLFQPAMRFHGWLLAFMTRRKEMNMDIQWCTVHGCTSHWLGSLVIIGNSCQLGHSVQEKNKEKTCPVWPLQSLEASSTLHHFYAFNHGKLQGEGVRVRAQCEH